MDAGACIASIAHGDDAGETGPYTTEQIGFKEGLGKISINAKAVLAWVPARTG